MTALKLWIIVVSREGHLKGRRSAYLGGADTNVARDNLGTGEESESGHGSNMCEKHVGAAWVIRDSVLVMVLEINGADSNRNCFLKRREAARCGIENGNKKLDR